MVSNFTDENCWRKKLSNYNSTTVFFDNIFRQNTTAFDKIFKIFCQNLSKNAVYDSFFRQYILTIFFAKNFRQQFSTTVFFDNKFRQQFSHRMVFMSKKIVELKFDSLFRQHFSHWISNAVEICRRMTKNAVYDSFFRYYSTKKLVSKNSAEKCL